MNFFQVLRIFFEQIKFDGQRPTLAVIVIFNLR